MLRPVEHQLSRLVDFWQISQPAHLRHLAIIRDTAIINKNTYYVHYTYDNFTKLVNEGKASWEAVSTPAHDQTKEKKPTGTLIADPAIDEYGFLKLQSTLFHGRNNDATLDQCTQALNATKIPIRTTDLVASELIDGKFGD